MKNRNDELGEGDRARDHGNVLGCASKGHLHSDHVHMLVSIPPKYSVAQVVGFIKAKGAIDIAHTYLGRRRNYHGMHGMH